MDQLEAIWQDVQLRQAKLAGYGSVEDHKAAIEAKRKADEAAAAKARTEAAAKAEAERLAHEAEQLTKAKAAGFGSVEEWQADLRRQEDAAEWQAYADRFFRGLPMPQRQREAILDGAMLRPDQEAIAADILAMLMRGAIVALSGPRGTGKTHLGLEVIRRYSRQKRTTGRQPAKYAKLLDFFRDLKDAFGRDAAKTEWAVVAEYVKPALLVLDEVQERSGSDWELTQLTDLLDRRYTNRQATLLVSNLKREALAESLGASICSRLREDGDVFELAGESVREVIRKGLPCQRTGSADRFSTQKHTEKSAMSAACAAGNASNHECRTPAKDHEHD